MLRQQDYTSEVKPGIKKGARGAFFVTSACLELVNQAQSNHVVGRDTGTTGEFIVVQQVDFVINVGRHVFVEVVGRTQVNVFQDILIAETFDVLTFRLQVSNGRTQTEVELVLSNHFEVLRFVCITANSVCIAITAETGRVVGLGVLSCQVNVVRVVFQTTGVGFSVITTTFGQRVLIISTFGVAVSETSADAVPDVISYGSTETVAVLFQSATTVVGCAFAANAAVFTLVLQSKVQAVNQTEEVRVTVGCNAVSTGLQEVVRTVGVAAEFRQNVGPGSYVVNNAVVTTVIERARVAKFQTSKRQTSSCLIA